MTENKTGRLNCSTCGDPLHAVQNEAAVRGFIALCPKCAKVDELITQLLRKKSQQTSL